MDFLTFCQHISVKKTVPDKKISFIGISESLALDYRALCRILFAKYAIDFGEILAFTADSFDEHIATLSMSFLGTTKTYWILGIEAASPATQKKWLQMLATIETPHRIFVIHNDKKMHLGTSILLKNTILQKEAEILAYVLLGRPIQQIKPFFAALKNAVNRISPAVLHVLLSYSQVVSVKTEPFFTLWIPAIFLPEQSLFQLADTFFSRNMEEFLSLFHTVSDQYPTAFWCTFFSEQVFKAALVIHAKQNDFTISPELEYRLPFNFLKKYWKNHTFNNLVQLHKDIALFDIALKKGVVREKKLELLLISYLEH